ncbi:hypothetical protein BURKHO8Y_120021 [Burkholderia sp. 8Y]|nr:hypothetical protein BURKHO8Y_120021 [Burkholderia sp. 8Y]
MPAAIRVSERHDSKNQSIQSFIATRRKKIITDAFQCESRSEVISKRSPIIWTQTTRSICIGQERRWT